MTLNWAWFVFYGHMLNMTENEVRHTPYGMMLDLIDCLAIYKGAAHQKEKKLTYDEIMQLK